MQEVLLSEYHRDCRGSLCVPPPQKVHAEVRGGHRLFCPITLCHIPLRQGLSLNLQLGWWPASPSNPSASTLIPSFSGCC